MYLIRLRSPSLKCCFTRCRSFTLIGHSSNCICRSLSAPGLAKSRSSSYLIFLMGLVEPAPDLTHLEKNKVEMLVVRQSDRSASDLNLEIYIGLLYKNLVNVRPFALLNVISTTVYTGRCLILDWLYLDQVTS